MNDEERREFAELSRRVSVLETQLAGTRFALCTLLHSAVQLPKLQAWYIANHALRRYSAQGHDELMQAFPLSDAEIAARMGAAEALHPPEWAPLIEAERKHFG